MKHLGLIISIFYFLAFQSIGYAWDENYPRGIIPDSSQQFSTNTTVVKPESDPNNYNIQGGVAASNNLFHNFQQFNLYSDERATFKSPSNVENIISRVTGGNISQINGNILSHLIDSDSNSSANLFFINPSGVMFGPSASVNIDGSFHVSTADYLKMGDKTLSNNTPSDQLLTITAPPSAFGFLNSSNGSIYIEGDGEKKASSDGAYGLIAKKGKTLSLIGGSIVCINGSYYQEKTTDNPLGTITAEDGTINLASVISGEVSLQETGPVITDGTSLGDITFSDYCRVDTSGDNPGKIYIRSEQLVMSNNSFMVSENFGSGQGGSIDIAVKGLILNNKSLISTGSKTSVKGSSGSISIKGYSVFLQDNGSISSINNGELDGGNIVLEVSILNLDNQSSLSVDAVGQGKGGNITIKGQNNANATYINIVGSNLYAGSLGSKINDGDAGTISIKVNFLSLMPGYVLLDSGLTSLQNQADFPKEYIPMISDLKNIRYYSESDASEAIVAKIPNISTQNSQQAVKAMIQGSKIGSESLGGGNSGNVIIESDNNVSLGAGSSIQANASGEIADAGTAGDIVITSRNISLSGSILGTSEISSQSKGGGNAGNVSLIATDLISIGIQSQIQVNTIGTVAKNGKAGDAGNILMDANRIELKQGGAVRSESGGEGNSGKITLRAKNSIVISGLDATGDASSIRSRAIGQSQTAGKGGDILLDAETISLIYGGFIGGESAGPGHGGSVTLNASDKIEFYGIDSYGYASKVYTSSLVKQGTVAGNAGNIQLNTTNLSFKDGGGLVASTLGPGKGGSLTINVSDTIEISGGNPAGENEDGFGSGIFARSDGDGENGGIAGDLTLVTEKLIIKDGGLITNSTRGAGTGGKVDITVNKYVDISGEGAQVSSDKYLESQKEFIKSGAQKEKDYISGLYSSSESNNLYGGKAGNVKLTTPDLKMRNKAKISTSSEGGGDAGDIDLTIKTLSLDKQASVQSSSNATGESGDAGRISIKADNGISIESLAFITTSTGGHGNAGAILLTSPLLTMNSGGSVSSSSNSIGNSGDAGTITIKLTDTLTLSGSDTIINTSSAGKGKAGDITISSKLINLKLGASISSASKSVSDIIMLVNTPSELSQLPSKPGLVAEVANDGTGQNAFYIYTGTQWVKKDDTHPINVIIVNDITERNALSPNIGDVAKVKDSGDGKSKTFIYSGQWVTIQGDQSLPQNIYIVDTISERNSLVAEEGEIARVTNASRANETYVFQNNQWVTISWDVVYANSTVKNYILKTLAQRNGLLPKASDRATIPSLSESYLYGNSKWNEYVAAGDAGTIAASVADKLNIFDGSMFNTEAISGGGGKIAIDVGNMMYLKSGKISASVQKGYGKGGDIRVASYNVTLLHSGIEANAVEGDGGAIFIYTDQYVKSDDSAVTATSERGNDGVVKIIAPKVDISKGLTVLPTSFLDATRWVKTPCSLRTAEKISRLVVTHRDAVPTSIDDWQPSPPVGYTPEEESLSLFDEEPYPYAMKATKKYDLTLE